MNRTNELQWSDALWQEINDAITEEMHRVRTAQKVFPTVVADNNPTEIPNETIDFDNFSIEEGGTKQFVEIYIEFSLTGAQVANEATAKTGKTLARMAAKEIALAEDGFIFRGKAKNAAGPGNVKLEPLSTVFQGLLDIAGVGKDIPQQKDPGLPLGEKIFSELADGIVRLAADAQAPPFALFLPSKVYADTLFVAGDESGLVTIADRIRPLVEGGFYQCVSLPPDIGLLVALGGDPTSIHLAHEARAESVRREGSRYIFRVVQRVQFIARDPRAFVLFAFDCAKSKTHK